MKEREYGARIILTGHLTPTHDRTRATITLDNGESITVKVRAFLRPKLTHATTQPLELHLWPRTNREGHLAPNTQLYKIKPATTPRNEALLVGRLVRKNSTESAATLHIRRNENGNLSREFYLTTALTPEALQALPRPLPPGVKPHEGVTLQGLLKNHHLRITSVTPTHLKTPKPLKPTRDARPTD